MAAVLSSLLQLPVPDLVDSVIGQRRRERKRGYRSHSAEAQREWVT
jgi:hypothetical protein